MPPFRFFTPLTRWVLLIVLLICGSLASSGPPRRLIEVYFSPRGGCTEAIIREIKSARKVIAVQAYAFTHVAIAQSLVDAHRRGVMVSVILDPKQSSQKYTSATFLSNSGVPTKIDSKHAASHNKVIIIDQVTVITGSFNFSKAAEEDNAENLLIIRDPHVVHAYWTNFLHHLNHSDPYTRKE
jgi:phosphatidylserine/phosphatidylglycerophosphate/cardiolipin synthase-like enzyme